MKQLEKDFEDLKTERDTLREEKNKMESKCQQTDELLETIQALKTENSKYKEDLTRKQVDVSGVTEQPSLDSNAPYDRAMKLGEKYNELYNNEWTDALEILCENGSDEEGNVEKLQDILKKCYKLCQDLSEKQMMLLENVLLNPGSYVTPTNTKFPKQVWDDTDNAVLSKSTYKQLKDCRIWVAPKAWVNIFKAHARSRIGWIAEDIPVFVKRCIEVCWLMCTQDPPVYIGNEADVGSAFDCNMYKPHSISGTIVSYNVWPPLLLHKDGPLLVKGIVQPIKVSRVKIPIAEPKPKTPAVVDRPIYVSPYSRTLKQREATAKPTKYYDKTTFDRDGTSPPREKYYSGSHTRKEHEEQRLYNAAEGGQRVPSSRCSSQ